MIKRNATIGSGATTWYTGWINILFPFVDAQKSSNKYCVPYEMTRDYVKQGIKNYEFDPFGGGHDKQVYGDGIEPSDYPCGLAKAPVIWDYLGTEFNLFFVSGFVGAKQDEKSLELSPVIGWFIGEQGQPQKDQDYW